jgi:peptidoglycan/LPS O-acetylase OafA/YrhL
MSASTKVKTDARFPFLDGLRGWGAVTVVLSHLFIQIFPPSSGVRAAVWKLFFVNGTFAVAVFFVVSGMSLSVGYLSKMDDAGLFRIAIGRYFRLTIPIVIACIFVWLLVVSGAMTDSLHQANAHSLAADLKFALYGVYFHNIAMLSPIPQLWTMPIEMMGSIILFLILPIALRARFRPFIYALAFLLLWRWQPYVSLFVAGLAIAEYLVIKKRNAEHMSTVGLACIVISIIAATFMTGTDAEEPFSVGAILMVSGVAMSSGARRLLESPLSRWLGKISFPLYLLHGAIIFSFGERFHGFVAPKSDWTISLTNLVIAAVCLGVAAAATFIDKAGITAARTIGRLLFPIPRASV